jgi:hypothetical protein
MADGSVVEAKSFNASDGAGIGFAHRAGIKTESFQDAARPTGVRKN